MSRTLRDACRGSLRPQSRIARRLMNSDNPHSHATDAGSMVSIATHEDALKDKQIK